MYFINLITLPCELDSYSEIIDVRSPSEFAIDHIPGAINVPVLNDQERNDVGTLYRSSPFEARKLGASLISANAAKALEKHFSDKTIEYRPLLYCWRGGMRSRSVAYILDSIGFKANVLKGGYRSFRRFVVEDLNRILTRTTLKLTVLSGLTGVGKTRMLHTLEKCGEQVLDLEGLANHKGSLLGNPITGRQPSQKQFETRLWSVLKEFDAQRRIWTEAESNRIGNVHCPPDIWKKLSQSDLVELDLPIDQRCLLLSQDYSHFYSQPSKLIDLLNALIRLRGRQQVKQWQMLIEKGDWEGFIRSILTNHYDLSYRKPNDGKSIYAAPKMELTIQSASDESFKSAALSLINLNA